jgi:hypothetical protein
MCSDVTQGINIVITASQIACDMPVHEKEYEKL